MSNLLFANVSGIFRAVEHFQDILNQLPVANWHQAGKSVGSPCPGQTASALESTSQHGCSMRRPRFSNGAVLGLVALTIAAAARRASRRRR